MVQVMPMAFLPSPSPVDQGERLQVGALQASAGSGHLLTSLGRGYAAAPTDTWSGLAS